MARKRRDEELVAQFLEAIQELGLSQNEVEKLVPGVTQSDVSRWERGEWVRITAAKARALKAFLADRASTGHLVVREGTVAYDPNPDPEGTPAEQLMAYLQVRVGMRRLAGELTSKDLVAVAYTLARREGFDAEEYKKLDAWRDQILEEERGR